MIPSITALSLESAKRLQGIFFDIDDTFTTRGKIGGRAFQALWDLQGSGAEGVSLLSPQRRGAYLQQDRNAQHLKSPAPYSRQKGDPW